MLRSTLKTLAITGLCVGGVLASDSIAQEETEHVEQGIMQIEMAVDDESGGAPIVISSSSMSFGDGSDGESNFSFFSGGDLGGDWMPGGGKVDPMSLLDNKDVRAELELVGEQLDKYREAKKDFLAQIKEKTQALTSGKLDPSQMGDFARELGEMKKVGQERMRSMLLPHQMERLKQVALQMEMKRRGAASTLVSKEMAEELGIDAAQKKRIEERQKELKKELAERMAKLKEEIQEKLLAELTSEQKAKLKELSGDKFDYKPTNINDQIRERIQKRMKSRIGG